MNYKYWGFLSILVLLLSSSISTARTRQASVENFLDELRISEDGFANTPGGEIGIRSSTEAMEISSILNFNINNSLDILLFYQKSQNESGGFSRIPDEIVTWDDTILAIRGLNYLQVNQSQIQNWRVFSYLNETAFSLLYTNITNNNESAIVHSNLTLPLIDIWYDYILSSFNLGFYPLLDTPYLVTKLQEFQFSNGTYVDFETAVTTIHLLTLLNNNPRDADLASKFIRAFIQNNGAFANKQGGITSLRSTYLAIRALHELNEINKIEYFNELILFILNKQHTNSGFAEVGSSTPTLKDTWLAIYSLFLLERIHELLSPDVLQTEGFISYNFVIILMGLPILALRRKIRG